MINIAENEVQSILQSVGNRSFSTFDFINSLKRLYPATWGLLVKEYGEGGAGAGKFYSAYSRVAHILNKLSNSKGIAKLDYHPAPEGWGSPVIRYWALTTSQQEFPEEIPNPETVFEGAKKTITVNMYERNSGARLKCIEKWGINCMVCGFSFENTYGELGTGYIHVHHLLPLRKIRKQYELDPIKDLRPVCPNCHAMLHRNGGDISISELKALLKLKPNYAIKVTAE